MRRWKLFVAAIFILTLNGCVKEYNITEEQSNEVAEYMSALILDNDDDYDQSLTPMKEIVEDSSEDEMITGTPIPSVTPDGVSNPNAEKEDAKDQIEYTLSEVIGAKDLDIQYKGYKLAETYPEDMDKTYFSIDAREGYQLLVAKFSVKNNSDSEERLNLSKTDIQFMLDVNDGTAYKPQFTLLENDLQYVDITVKSGKTKEVLLVYEIKTDEISNINLAISKDEKSNIIEIK
jgi:hypothetical protein